MCILPVTAIPKLNRLFLMAFFLLLIIPLNQVNACECHWRGPFLSVVRDAPLVVHGRILRHNTGSHPSMDVLILETLSGGVLDSGLRIQMGDGLHCRPEAENFPVGSEWILAINGPGSKPGKGLALSICGEYWLRVEGAEVLGSIDGRQGEVKRLSLSRLHNRIRYPTFMNELRGRLRDGERFRQPFGPGFEFVLEPNPAGWEIVIREQGREENLARLKPGIWWSPRHPVLVPMLPTSGRPSLENSFFLQTWVAASPDQRRRGRSVRKISRQCGALDVASSPLSGSKSVVMIRIVPVLKPLNSRYTLKADIEWNNNLWSEVCDEKDDTRSRSPLCNNSGRDSVLLTELLAGI